jgi:hypothetical protein
VHIFSPMAGSLSRLSRVTAILVLLTALGGCATAPPPNDSMNQAQAQLQGARDAGAADYAPVDLGFAQDKFQQAQAAMADRKYASATNLAEESRADAELAMAKARLGSARAQIQGKMQENTNLRTQGEQAEAAAEQKEQQEQAQDQQMHQQQAAPAGATSLPPPPTEDMPAPSSSILSAPPSSSSSGFQAVPGSSQPDSGQPDNNHNGDQS